jgi:hypothetical protein
MTTARASEILGNRDGCTEIQQCSASLKNATKGAKGEGGGFKKCEQRDELASSV